MTDDRPPSRASEDDARGEPTDERDRAEQVAAFYRKQLADQRIELYESARDRPGDNHTDRPADRPAIERRPEQTAQ